MPNRVGSGFEGVFSSTVEEKRRMRVLYGKDAGGVGGNSEENQREMERGEQREFVCELTLEVAQDNKHSLPIPQYKLPRMCLRS